MCPRCYAWPSLYMYDCTCCCNFFHVDPFPSICRLVLFFWGVSSSSSCAGLMAISFVSLIAINYSLFIHAILAGWFGLCRLPFILYRWFERDFPQWTFCYPKLFSYKIRPKNNSEHKNKFYHTPKKEEEGSDDYLKKKFTFGFSFHLHINITKSVRWSVSNTRT